MFNTTSPDFLGCVFLFGISWKDISNLTSKLLFLLRWEIWGPLPKLCFSLQKKRSELNTAWVHESSAIHVGSFLGGSATPSLHQGQKNQQSSFGGCVVLSEAKICFNLWCQVSTVPLLIFMVDTALKWADHASGKLEVIKQIFLGLG